MKLNFLFLFCFSLTLQITKMNKRKHYPDLPIGNTHGVHLRKLSRYKASTLKILIMNSRSSLSFDFFQADDMLGKAGSAGQFTSTSAFQKIWRKPLCKLICSRREFVIVWSTSWVWIAITCRLENKVLVN